MRNPVPKIITLTTLAITLSACSVPLGPSPDPVVQTPQTPREHADKRPKIRPDVIETNTNPKPPITVAQGAKTSVAAKEKATKPAAGPEQDKGITIASLGLLDRDGYWLATPLVNTEKDGRIVVKNTGASLNVSLLPNGTAPGSGSQLSIAALQTLGIPITDLVEIRVFIR